MADTRTESGRDSGPIVVRPKAALLSESVVLSDFAECLLQAYDGVARRAYQKYAARGYKRGQDNEDWLAAQQELGFQMRVDVAESEKFVHAMVGVDGEHSAEVCVAIEGRWLLVLNAQEFASQGVPATALDALEWNSEAGRADTVREWPWIGTCFGRREGAGEIWSEEAEEQESLRLRWGSQPFCLVELPVDVDRARTVGVLAEGTLALRMVKVGARNLAKVQ
jgi:hypothetical protein